MMAVLRSQRKVLFGYYIGPRKYGQARDRRKQLCEKV